MNDRRTLIRDGSSASQVVISPGDPQTSRTPLEVLDLYASTGETLWGLVESRASVRGERPFLLFADKVLSWSAFRDQVLRAARVLTMLGVTPGDRVAIMAANRVEHVVLFFAAARVRAIFVPVNPELGLSEASHIFCHATPAVVFCTFSLWHLAVDACQSPGHLPRFVSLDTPFDGEPVYQSLVDRSSTELPLPRPYADDTCLILYTSGTTGLPKGVMHSQRNYVGAAEVFVERLHLQPEDRLMCVLPFFHTNALVYSLGGAVAAGGSLIVAPRFSASDFWRMATRYGATQVNIIAAVGRILARRPREEFVPSHGIRKIYGVPITPDMYDIFQNEFCVPDLIEGYGMTEVPSVCSVPFEGPRKKGSMGRAALHPDHSRPFAQMRVVDPEMHDVRAGDVGQLVVKTPIALQGYWKDPQATADAFVDGWFLTGDLVRRSSDGFYTFVARQKDIIRRRGENISGAELDRVIAQLPGVEEVAAIGVESELGEEEILVAIVKRSDAELNAQNVHAWCKHHLSAIKVPRFLVFMESLPHTPTHRIAKFLLKQDTTLRSRATEFPPKGF